MNVIKEIERINKAELANGSVNTPASWHVKYAESAWVYAGNLPVKLSEGDILAVMSQWGEVEDINLVRDDKDTGKSRGFCFLKYEDARSCVLAVDNFNGTKILGRSIRVDHVENYRLPKHLREEDEGDEKNTTQQGPSESENSIQNGNGHAYAGKELANSFDINSGQDLFAAPSPAVTDTNIENEGIDMIITKKERKEARQKRKEIRDKERREKEARKEEREERRREKRGKRLAHEKKRSRHNRDKAQR